jgi:restriction endonuclease S subunit
MDLKIPLPTIDIQNQIVDHIEMTRSKINILNQTAQLNRANAIIEFEAEIFNEA